MNAQEVLQLLDGEDHYGPDELDGFIIIETRTDTERKWVFTTTIIQHVESGEYFEVRESCSNSGYWSDSEQGETTVVKVAPREVTIKTTVWDRVK